MYLQEINFTQLPLYIEVAFKGDEELSRFYDREANVKCLDEMVFNTYTKLLEYTLSYKCKSYKVVAENGADIGFLFITHNPNLLVSFSLSIEYRDKTNLQTFFNLISKKMEDENFTCYLFNENTRAIDWLVKCGMKPYKLKGCDNITALHKLN